ncbi:hypothetical protein [Pseudomonas sp. NA-150]
MHNADLLATPARCLSGIDDTGGTAILNAGANTVMLALLLLSQLPPT